ncbi:hypothetical protein PENVUL_c089G09200 [Penicillium vulpinum]|uniref:Uncharacterized protein n=1 Tax=Penicillium vulpinum TaxID=29845 RepID=A0A1V6R4R9_9EURO|nr:hypothetical protein PENVUL_c089G09200 [Penicillium vulpinum]
MVELQMGCWIAGELHVGNYHLVQEMKKKHEDLLVGLAKVQQVRDVLAETLPKLHVGQAHGEDESALIVKKHTVDRDADWMTASVPDKVLMVAAEVGLHCDFWVELGYCHQPWSRLSEVPNMLFRESKKANGCQPILGLRDLTVVVGGKTPYRGSDLGTKTDLVVSTNVESVPESESATYYGLRGKQE